MHHQGQGTTEVDGDHFRSTGVKLWATVDDDDVVDANDDDRAEWELRVAT